MQRTESNSKNQHYVWRYYLSAWAANGGFCCYRQKEKKLFSTMPKSIASETYFYEMQQLSADDIKFVTDFISVSTNERLRELNREYLNLSQLSFQLRDLLESENIIPQFRAALHEKLRWAERNLGERFHNSVENNCQDILDALRAGDEAFYKEKARCIDFIYFLSLQYFRTSKIRQGLSRICAYLPNHNPQRTAPILQHILANNLGSTLFQERSTYRVVFLKNPSSIPFITGDQPVLNMLNLKATDDIEFYYPLSPKLAITLTKDFARFPHRERNLTLLEVERYNYAIYSMSEDQLYSDNLSYLSSVTTIGKNML